MVVVADKKFMIPAGDYGLVYTVALYENDGTTLFNLTGYTVTLKVWEEGISGTVLVSSACTIISAINGSFTFTPADGDFPASYINRKLKGEFELTISGSKVGSSNSFDVVVTESG